MNQLPSTGGAGYCRNRDRDRERLGGAEVIAEPLAIYIHTPFCPTKCGYCDFNSYAMTGDIVHETALAIAEEIRRSPWAGIPAKTIFVGGGTPTFLAVEDLVAILVAALETHPPVGDIEITSEANPGTVDAEKFARMREAGFNRVSLGAQSFLDSELVRLGRIHRAGEIERAVQLAREAGFDNLNLDLMFALPGQNQRGWEANLDRAFALDPNHLSLYCLTIEPNTAFHQQHLKGQLVVPDEDEQVDMYETACRRAEAAGFAQYEISNFAKPGRESQHNLCYWRAESYAGYGPGAVGFVDGVRYTNLKHPVRYRDAIVANEPLPFERETIDEATHRIEKIMLGIRLSEGIAMDGLDEKAVLNLVERGWVEEFLFDFRGEETTFENQKSKIKNRLRLTAAGRHFCSEVALELIG